MPPTAGGTLTEEFHQTYAISADGRVELDNINGPVHISSWDRNEVKVDAIKYADTKERLDEAKIEVDSRQGLTFRFKRKYPHHDQTWNWGRIQSSERGIHVDGTSYGAAG